jgi:anti-sigma B factor antagonist
MIDRRQPQLGQFHVDTERDGDRVLVRPSGELDLATVERLRDALDRAQARETALIVLDLSGLEFVDITGVHAIVDGERSAKLNGYEFGLVGATGEVARALGICGVARESVRHDEQIEGPRHRRMS